MSDELRIIVAHGFITNQGLGRPTDFLSCVDEYSSPTTLTGKFTSTVGNLQDKFGLDSLDFSAGTPLNFMVGSAPSGVDTSKINPSSIISTISEKSAALVTNGVAGILQNIDMASVFASSANRVNGILKFAEETADQFKGFQDIITNGLPNKKDIAALLSKFDSMGELFNVSEITNWNGSFSLVKKMVNLGLYDLAELTDKIYEKGINLFEETVGTQKELDRILKNITGKDLENVVDKLGMDTSILSSVKSLHDLTKLELQPIFKNIGKESLDRIQEIAKDFSNNDEFKKFAEKVSAVPDFKHLDQLKQSIPDNIKSDMMRFTGGGGEVSVDSVVGLMSGTKYTGTLDLASQISKELSETPAGQTVEQISAELDSLVQSSPEFTQEIQDKINDLTSAVENMYDSLSSSLKNTVNSVGEGWEKMTSSLATEIDIAEKVQISQEVFLNETALVNKALNFRVPTTASQRDFYIKMATDDLYGDAIRALMTKVID